MQNNVYLKLIAVHSHIIDRELSEEMVSRWN